MNADFKPSESRGIASLLRSPALAVVAAYLLRMALFWLSYHHIDYEHPRFGTVGVEASLVANSLAAGRGFFGPYPRYQAATAILAPVYPFLGAIGYKIYHLDSFAATLFFQIMNCAFSAATCWPIHAIGKKLFGERIGLASAWCWVFFPYAVLLPLEWTWDQSLSALLLAIIVWATLALPDNASPSSLAWSGYGLLWGFSALVNPALCAPLPFLLVWIAYRRRRAGLESLKFVATSVFMFVLALVPWTIRNYYAVDGLIFVKSNFGMELWLGNNPAVKQIYSVELHPGKNAQQLLQMILEGEPNYNRQKEREAIVYIEAQPAAFVKNTFERVEDTWTDAYDSEIDPWILTLGARQADVWFCSIFTIIAFVGMILAQRLNFSDSLPLALCIFLIPLPYYLTRPSLRYRHPIDPFLTIFAVYAMARLVSALRRATAPKLAARSVS